MREIKFRMWSKDVNRYWYDPVNVYDCLKQSKIPEHKGLYDDMVWQQFTGMKDKNGTEIYEGDIVKGLYKDTDYNHWDEIKASVVYCDRFAGFSVGCENWVKQTIEVIGNVFENPELLK